MTRPIPDAGPRNARIVVIGEMDSIAEEAQNRHLVGPAGSEWNEWLRKAALAREHLYITNVVPWRAAASNKIDDVPRDILQQCVRELHAKLATLDPWVIVPMGNTALRALTGLHGITKYRGSILDYRDANGHTRKVIPSVHPASLIYQKKAVAEQHGASSGGKRNWERRCVLDWVRIREDAAFRELRVPDREHFIEPRLFDLEDYVAEAEAHAELMAIDLEWPKKIDVVTVEQKRGKKTTTVSKRVKGDPRITVFGMSYEPHFSMTVPTTASYWAPQGVDVQTQVWPLLRRLCNIRNVEYGGQNFHSDLFWLLREHDCPVRSFVWDTRWLSHCRFVLDEHKLGYQASIYLRTRYWKSRDEDDDNGEKHVDPPTLEGLREHWTYNGRDNTHTRELMDVHIAWLAEHELLAHYLKRYVPLYEPMLDMSLRGLRTDQRTVRRQQARFIAERIGLQESINDAAGTQLFGPKGSLVPKRLNTFLYETLRLPVQKDRKTGNASSNEIVVRRLMRKHPTKLGTVGPMILRNRRLEALSRFVKEGIVDDDGYTRTQYGFTYTMRFTSGKAANRRGSNLQNTDRELLAMYVPDPGHLFLEVDESQGEDRIVKTLAAALPTTSAVRRADLLRRARAMPWENDEHRLAASLIFGKPQDAITKDERYIGKRGRHAGNYGMRGKTLSEQLLKEGYSYDADECDHFIDTVIDKDTPEVRDWQRSTRQVVLRNRSLTNSWGHCVDFTYERLGDDLYREAYATIPQSELTSIIKYWGLIPLHRLLRREGWEARIALEKHDSLLISTHPKHAWDILTFLRTSLERPRTYGGFELTIPIEAKIGANGAMAREFKRPPTRDEFEAALVDLVR